MKEIRTHFLFMSFVVSVLSACNPPKRLVEATQDLEKIEDCQNLLQQTWPILNNLSESEEGIQSWQELREELLNAPQERLQQLTRLVDILEKYLGDGFWKKSVDEQKEIWAQLELKIDERIELRPLLQAIEKFESTLDLGSRNCREEDQLQGQSNEVSVGARRLMIGAYQSCQSYQLAALDESTKDVEGIEVVGNHSDGVGKVRKIQALTSVQLTHPYLRIQETSSNCFQVQSHPLIYDYGGKMSYPRGQGKLISAFKNAGSGSSALGIDCSALVISSIGLAGLRLKPNLDLTASQTAAFGTATLIEFPKHFPCFEYVRIGPQQTLKSGDILTVRGHTLIIDRVGLDPWGIEGIQAEASCAAIDGSKFDFDIFHSSPLFGAVGIQKTSARMYSKEDSAAARGLLKYAREHCLQSLRGKLSQPKWTDVSLVRHKKTRECLGKPLQLEGQDCVNHCW